MLRFTLLEKYCNSKSTWTRFVGRQLFIWDLNFFHVLWYCWWKKSTTWDLWHFENSEANKLRPWFLSSTISAVGVDPMMLQKTHDLNRVFMNIDMASGGKKARAAAMMSLTLLTCHSMIIVQFCGFLQEDYWKRHRIWWICISYSHQSLQTVGK